jgi:diacylglycerol O-acyltransferase / wax synthase
MDPLEPLDVAMLTAELLSNPLHVGAALILSPPKDADPDYVDQLYREALTADDPVDPRLPTMSHRSSFFLSLSSTTMRAASFPSSLRSSL